MKITELKDKIIIAELDPEKDYLILFDRTQVRPEDLMYAKSNLEPLRRIPVIPVDDVTKALRFVEIPRKGKHR